MKRRSSILSLLLLTLTLTLFAQSPCRIATWNSSSGLSNEYVVTISEDGQGFLWVGTEYGLYRLDGYKAYKGAWKDSDISRELYSVSITALLYDGPRNCLWIGTKYNGLYCIELSSGDVRKWDKTTAGLQDNRISALAKSEDGTLWIGTINSGVAQLDPQKETITTLQTEDTPYTLSSIAATPSGELWVGTSFHGIYRLNPYSGKSEHWDSDKGLPSEHINSVLIDSSGRIWAGTDSGLARYNAATNDFIHTGGSSKIKSLSEDATHRIWIGTENDALILFSPSDMRGSRAQKGDFKYFNTTSTPAISNKTIRSIYSSPSGITYIGTYGDGIDVFTFEKELSTILTKNSQPASLSQKEATTMVIDPTDASLWVGMDGAGIDVFDKEWNKTHYDSSNSAIDDGAILASFCASDSTLWFATYTGEVLRRRRGRKLEKVSVEGMNDCRSIAEGPDGKIFFANSGGISVYNPATGDSQAYTTWHSAEFSHLIVRSIAVDQKGRLFAGTEGQGLYIYDSSMNVLGHVGEGYGPLSSNFINHLILSSSGDVLLATDNGFFEYNPDTNTTSEITLSSSSGGEPLRARSLLEEEDGTLWVSTVDRIYKLDRLSGQLYDYSFTAQGIVSDFYGRSVAMNEDGSIFFGSHSGLCGFSTHDLRPTESPDIRFSSLGTLKKIGAKDEIFYYGLEDKLLLKHDQNSFIVNFSTINPSLAGKVEYEYRVIGLGDEAWFNNGTDNSLTFHNLPSGSYTLEVSAKLFNMEFGENISRLNFRIQTLPWLSVWAWIIYACLFSALLYAIIYYSRTYVRYRAMLSEEKKKREQQDKLNEERLSFFTNITHELRTPLTLIISPLDDIIASPRLNKVVKDKLTQVYKNASRLLDLINRILEFRKTETQYKRLCVKRADLRKLVEETGIRYRELNSNKNVSITTLISDGDYTFVFDPEIVRTILDNLMSNACKYTPSGTITLSLDRSEEWTVVTVSDTGIGIREAALPHIFERYYQDNTDSNITSTGIGLALVENLVKLHHGEISVRSELGKGSSFSLRLSTSNMYTDSVYSMLGADNETNAPEIAEAAEEIERPILLIVEDNDEILNYIKDSFADEFIVHTATNGKEGLEKARKLIPDIIITDVMMPIMDGMKMVRQLKEGVATSHIPIIILTAKASVEDRTDAYTLGAESFIPKPFTIRLLRSRLTNILTRQRHLVQTLSETKGPATEHVRDKFLNPLDKKFIDKVDKVICDNLDDCTLDVKFIADSVCMSYSTLYRKMNAITGMSTHAYVKKKRMRKAAELLDTTSYTLSEISEMIGINSISIFRSSFKEEYGISPSEYLQKGIKRGL